MNNSQLPNSIDLLDCQCPQCTSQDTEKSISGELPEPTREAIHESHRPSLKTSEWLNTAEASEYLRISKGSLRNLVSEGRIPYYKLGKRLRFLRYELRRLLLSEKKGP